VFESKHILEVGMKSSRRKCPPKIAGYSLVEMMMTLAIGLIMVSVALPAMIGAIQGYRLNSIAQQTSNLIDLTRYAAIRHNTAVSLQKTVQSGNTVLFVDLDGDGKLGANEPMVMLPSDMQVANGDSNTPDPASTGVKNLQNFKSQIIFDSRGTLNYIGGLAPSPYFLALGYTNQPRYGCRAITVTQMGQAKTWKAPDHGTWSPM
jgi:prepilin-type N-terminal cleavage/methylation domain-containing protein